MKTVREEVVGKSTVRLLKEADGYAGVVIGPGGAGAPLRGTDADALWRKLLTEVGKAHPDYFGYDGARARFLRIFPAGFADPKYFAHERTYKTEAVGKVAAALPLERTAGASAADAMPALRVFQATNLLSIFEKARIKDVLQHAAGVDYLQAAAAFADGELDAGMAGMVAAIRAAGQAPSWPMLTYLPFLWRPDDHLFLKPNVTRDFAYRVGHSFGRDYDAGFVVNVYRSLLDLAGETQRELAALEPRDLIDVQSFIWVVGAYDDTDAASAAQG